MNDKQVAGVGFDVDHTLVIDNKLERIAMLRMLQTIEDDGGAPCRNLLEESRRIDELLACQRAGDFSIDEAVDRFVSERGIAPDARYVERFKTIALDMVEQVVVPLPGARDALRELQRCGMRVAVLSNGWNPLQIAKARRAGFDGPVIASADIGVQKPDPRAFDALVETLGTLPGQTCYVGDGPSIDVAGAAKAGLQTVWIDADELPYPAGVAPPDYRVECLSDLPALLNGANLAME
ncbi:MAG TPA: HAD family hydrolase [Candidatus Tumulicola sp.]|jgi:HAD superfamily hydrolase (TIGR01509 family)